MALLSPKAFWFHVRQHAVVVLLSVIYPRDLSAEDAISYKYQDYQESGGRIGVRVQSAFLEKSLGSRTTLKLSGVLDTIAGATPTGQPPATRGGEVPLSFLEEKRKAWTAELVRTFRVGKLALGAAASRESDYVSRGGSLNGSIDFNQKNTSLTLGVGATDDDVKVFYRTPWEDKQSVDVILGVTQLLGPLTLVTLNATHSRATGYLSDPYKLVQKNVEVVPGIFLPRTFGENRPDQREKWILHTGVNRAFWEGRGAVDASYRYFSDDFGIQAHTVLLEWYQKWGAQITIRPHVRYSVQSAADFYHVTLTGTSIVPERIPTGKGAYYSADYRLSALSSLNYGVKLVWDPREDLQVDTAIERYEMRGRDGGETSASAYPRALILTAGITWKF
ncbi:MAG TPA: DUF3570 domain-containing protein [Opitutaceae bacterium]|nr:DUF3570 domain-containing protein [Opitutaceae bacterium]